MSAFGVRGQYGDQCRTLRTYSPNSDVPTTQSCVLFVFGNDHSVGAMCAYVDVLGV